VFIVQKRSLSENPVGEKDESVNTPGSRKHPAYPHLGVIEMRLAVRSGVESRDFHGSAAVVSKPDG